MRNPCWMCPRREPMCHGRCPDYGDFVGWRAYVREKERQLSVCRSVSRAEYYKRLDAMDQRKADKARR